jgi:DNA polymerase-3 subunit chi
MGVLRFYHLTRAPVERTLPKLLRRAVEAGLRVQVRCPAPDRADWLDQALWLDPDDAFLPHGLSGGPHDALQPVLISGGHQLADGITCLMSVEGAAVDPDEPARLDRTFILFDGHDADALAHARGQWKALTSVGVAAEYWSEASGRWALERATGVE